LNESIRIDEFDVRQSRRFRAGQYATGAPLSTFPSLEQVYQWINQLETRYSDKVTVEQIGTSTEGLPMLVVKINEGKGPVAFIESAIHAREWLSPTSAIFIIDSILTGKMGSIATKYEFNFLVITNVDGYKHTHDFKHTTAGRFWRSNRKYFGPNCQGVDLNRNFDVDFGRVGVSHSCYNDPSIYCGPKGFSEVETQYISQYLTSTHQQKTIKFYLSFHSFGQMIILPVAYTRRHNSLRRSVQRVAEEARKAIYSYRGNNYRIGNTYELGLGEVSGSSVDWVQEKLGVMYSFALEVSPSQSVHPLMGGFNPSSSEISPTGQEMFLAVKRMLEVI